MNVRRPGRRLVEFIRHSSSASLKGVPVVTPRRLACHVDICASRANTNAAGAVMPLYLASGVRSVDVAISMDRDNRQRVTLRHGAGASGVPARVHAVPDRVRGDQPGSRRDLIEVGSWTAARASFFFGRMGPRWWGRAVRAFQADSTGLVATIRYPLPSTPDPPETLADVLHWLA